MEIEFKITDDKLCRQRYELRNGKKWALDEGNGKLIITKDEFMACYKEWIEKEQANS